LDTEFANLDPNKIPIGKFGDKILLQQIFK
jgi:hypothetical protein